jgi:Zn-dependent M28 family amino/carboxypeptidase
MDIDRLAANLRAHVERLAATPRVPGTSAHEQARASIRRHFEQAGFPVEEVDAAGAGVNVLTRPLPDRPDLPLVIVGAHYDTVAGSPGADDNASAVASLLELATWIRPYLDGAGPWNARLVLASYDLEEYGLLGSGEQARALRRQAAAVRGMIALEMLGYTDHRPGSQQLPPHLKGLYPDVANFIGVCANEASAGLLRVVVAALKGVKDLPVEFIAVPGTGELVPEVRLSDHSSFWDEGYPALMITDTSFFRNPHYHQSSDTPDKLDYPFLARVTAGACAATLRLLQAPALA